MRKKIECCKYNTVEEDHEKRYDTDNVTPANGDKKGINAQRKCRC